MDRLFTRVYYSSDSPGFMGGIDKVYRESKRQNKKVTKRKVIEWLNRQRVYTLHKPGRRSFPRTKTTGVAMHSHIQIDTADLRRLKYHNSHYSYIVCAICVVTRQARCAATKTKKPAEVLPALRKMFDSYENTIYAVAADKGTEFLADVKKWLESVGIQVVQIEKSPHHASMAERFIRTLKNMLFRYMTFAKTKRWVDILPQVVQAYNSRYHRSIRRAPNSVTRENEQEFVQELYKRSSPVAKFKFSIGQHVRIREPKTNMEKGYTRSFTEETYTIAQQVPRSPAAYRLQSEKGYPIRGIWYNEELVAAGDEDGFLRTARVKQH